ncbi:hypothetical protein H0A36_27950 [Endozoicomonas sp. SM1973]|uniref:Uncharacterized protein n=1 Tax=Spartinivicinus marinus TaxID=2994442 RepID=A0A853I7G4_9GAMM|nr:hypothetical protein [Spartinivicinus marinus]MCX4026979.1 hypothetical protein [Spartinivicinus marinus]MCX4027908.1 hypothetical protein [Spartinivicinus marinus]NYZ69850.1 hypothetical protein [Spartinivicinus marinus]
MKLQYKPISNAKAGDQVLYKIGHRFKEDNMAPCTLVNSNKKKTTVYFYGDPKCDMAAKTTHFFTKVGELHE